MRISSAVITTPKSTPILVLAALLLALLGATAAHAQTTARDWYATNPQNGWLPLGSSGMAMPQPTWACPSDGTTCTQWFSTVPTPLSVNDPTAAKRAVPDGELPFK